jgi:hypothetical protein
VHLIACLRVLAACDCSGACRYPLCWVFACVCRYVCLIAVPFAHPCVCMCMCMCLVCVGLVGAATYAEFPSVPAWLVLDLGECVALNGLRIEGAAPPPSPLVTWSHWPSASAGCWVLSRCQALAAPTPLPNPRSLIPRGTHVVCGVVIPCLPSGLLHVECSHWPAAGCAPVDPSGLQRLASEWRVPDD